MNWSIFHDDVIKWKHFARYWPFVRGIHRSPVNSPHKGQWRRALVFSLICPRINGWVNNGDAGDLRRHRAHYDVIEMFYCLLHCGARLLGCNWWLHISDRNGGKYLRCFFNTKYWQISLQWRHNERDGVSNHQPYDCLLKRSFGHRSKKTSKLRVTGLCKGS